MRARVGRRPSIYGGMGDVTFDPSTGSVISSSDGSVNTDNSAIDANFMNWLQEGGDTNNPLNTTNGTTSSSSVNTTGMINSITNAFTSIFKAIQPLPQGCTQVAGPYGTSTQCTSAGSAALSLTNPLSSLGSSSGLLLLLGGGVLLVMMMKK